ncbi:MAG: paraquat-inducible protein [Alcanivoracaceae bacterium]|uniref:paraquat-inducible protein A n=1 Tax=Alcanivorax sp. MD8A TaxID=1177157 RepID=UPI000C3651A4|nr:paraquat-inducible protein A [Alcanivorax sp. MD8A]MAX56303.1 paraquat-inducible protein [Alcanivoracaceae bacterium]MED5431755.1 paraquat-inducible protein A [Pseudomonadota bacterium]MEE2870802.1 paraquat-inducible protein A [Pseudomonadota bacterium]PNE01889.1 paraquat-inducible protein [Alcanivorax sp. MD8A]|tara:strand:+ start:199 stop:693 length:495 start_codon:yes stop_codon:yes gene_type:complete
MPDKPHAKAWSLLVAATVWLVPANLLPIMTVTQGGRSKTSTIAEGIWQLFDAGMPGIAIIVMVASLLVPFFKVLVLAVVYWRAPTESQPLTSTRAYRLVYWVGRWSMLDVFVVALLVALVQFGNLANVQPEPGILAFGIAVVLTMLSAHAFSPNQLWNKDHGNS